MNRYHAHVYFPAAGLPLAEQLVEASRDLPAFEYGRIFPAAVGPHPLPMVEFGFASADLAVVREWLERNRGEFSVLIHEDAGDDVRDHTLNILWMGPALELDFEFFDRIQKDPSLRIHK